MEAGRRPRRRAEGLPLSPVRKDLSQTPTRPADERDPLAALLFRPGSVFCLQSHQGDVWTWYVGVEAKESERIEVDGQPVQPGELYWLLTSEAPLPDVASRLHSPTRPLYAQVANPGA